MRKYLLIVLPLILVSCFGDSDDNILDGDLITAITGVDSIYSSSGSYVDMDANVGDSGLGTADIVSGFADDRLRISLRVGTPSDLSNFESVTNLDLGNDVIINYTVFSDAQVKDYIVDDSDLFSFSLVKFSENEVIGNFEFTLINLNDPLDTITFREGFIYVYD
jgi:hypothetical protein